MFSETPQEEIPENAPANFKNFRRSIYGPTSLAEKGIDYTHNSTRVFGFIEGFAKGSGIVAIEQLGNLPTEELKPTPQPCIKSVNSFDSKSQALAAI
jgi:hypothetical protein